MLNVVVYINQIFEHQKIWCGAFVLGLKANGINARVMTSDVPVDCDLAVMWSHGPTWKNVIEARKKKNKQYLVLDRGYMGDQEEYVSISLNGLHGLSEFELGDGHDISDERSKEFTDLYKPWKPGKKYVLLIGQLAGDASLQGIDIRSWLGRKKRELKKAGHEVVYRPHPRNPNPGGFGMPYMVAELDECLKGAKCVYTYSSTVGIDAMLAGKPVIAESPISMVYDEVGHSVDDIKKTTKEPKGREQWFNMLAYRQWALEEIQSGEAWKFLTIGNVNA